MKPVDAVLAELAVRTSPGETWVPFAPIASATGLTTFHVRRVCPPVRSATDRWGQATAIVAACNAKLSGK